MQWSIMEQKWVVSDELDGVGPDDVSVENPNCERLETVVCAHDGSDVAG